MGEAPISIIFMRTVELANRRGLPEQWPLGAVVSFAIDDDWSVRINRAAEEQDEIPGFGMVFEHKGWPVGISEITGGAMMAGMEPVLQSALEAAHAKVEREAHRA